jgi:hypothetical protein
LIKSISWRIINGICRWHFVGIQEASISSSRLAAEVSIPKTFLLVRFPGASKLGMKIFKYFKQLSGISDIVPHKFSESQLGRLDAAGESISCHRRDCSIFFSIPAFSGPDLDRLLPSKPQSISSWFGQF